MLNLRLPITFQLAKRVFVSLIAIEIVFAAIFAGDYFLGSPSWRIHEYFNLDLEANIPAWFSSLQLFMIGFIALLTAWNQNCTTPPSRRGLTIFGLGFVFLSADEAALIHEKLTYEFHNNPLVPYFDGVYGVWIVVYGFIGLIALAMLARDIIALFKSYPKECFIFVLGMIIFLAGAAGGETITFFHLDMSDPLVHMIEVMVEEFLEMSGASTLLYSVLRLAIIKNQSPST